MATLTKYRCDRCQAEESAAAARLRFYVLDADERLNVWARLAWCDACGLVAKEYLPDLEFVAQTLADLESQGPSENDRQTAARQQQSVEQLVENRKAFMRRVIAWRENRVSPARCLKCASTEAFEFPPTPENRPSEFPHPGCGGTFRFVEEAPIPDPHIELFTPEGVAFTAAGVDIETLLSYLRSAATDPASVAPWSEWWAENDKHVSQAFSLVDYVRLKHRKLTGARQLLQARGELPKDFLPPSIQSSGSCEKCGERGVERPTPAGPRLGCPNCEPG